MNLMPGMARHGTAFEVQDHGRMERNLVLVDQEQGMDEHTFWAQRECTTMKTAIGGSLSY
jgi:hypothetical protein